MFVHWSIVGSAFLAALFLSVMFFNGFGRIEVLREKIAVAILTIYLSVLLVVVGIGCFAWYSSDFVTDINRSDFFVPLVSAVVIVGALFANKVWFVDGAVVATVFANVFLSDCLTIEFFSEYSLLVNKFVTCLVWSFFALGFRSLSGLNPLPQIETATISFGFVLLFLFGVAPFMMGVIASSLAATIVIAYVYSKKYPISIAGAPVLGYLLGLLGVLSYQEFLLPCFVGFAMFYFGELCVSSLKKGTLIQSYAKFEYNSVSFKAFNDGLPPNDLIKNLWFVNVVLIIFGLFQMNGVNTYSVPVFAGLVVLWNLYKIENWKDARNLTFKEANKEIVNDIKQVVKEIFDNSDKTNKTGKN